MSNIEKEPQEIYEETAENISEQRQIRREKLLKLVSCASPRSMTARRSWRRWGSRGRERNVCRNRVTFMREKRRKRSERYVLMPYYF